MPYSTWTNSQSYPKKVKHHAKNICVILSVNSSFNSEITYMSHHWQILIRNQAVFHLHTGVLISWSGRSTLILNSSERSCNKEENIVMIPFLRERQKHRSVPVCCETKLAEWIEKDELARIIMLIPKILNAQKIHRRS